MQDYYFTFGSNHPTLEGESLKDYWVRVTAPDYNSARQYFCNNFALPVIGEPMKWSFQYEEKNFKKSFFPKGEYQHLKVEEEPDSYPDIQPI